MNLQDLFNFWYDNEHVWFSPTEEDDMKVSLLFESFLDEAWIPANKQEQIAYIILFDQIPRHIFRNQPCEHIIIYYRLEALRAAKIVLQDMDSLLDGELVFALLPFRHQKTFESILYTINIVWERNPDNSILKRFLKAAYKSLPLDQKDRVIKCHDNNDCVCEKHNYTKYADILYNKHVHDTQDCEVVSQIFEENIKACKQSSMIVSISGGVDSMVCSYEMFRIAKDMGIRVIFVHINYCNKPTCHQDEAFVTKWCLEHGHDLYVRKIDEIKREPCMTYELRDMYETYTRNVRYATYKYVWTDVLKESGSPIVLLGHNKNDCFENILTNITQVQKYENLKGMSLLSVQDDITFVRPLLEVDKQSIRSFAFRKHIPHLHDSTPAWAQRGKIRDIVVPTLNSWDKRCIPAFFELSDAVQDLYNLLSVYVDDWVSRTTVYTVFTSLQLRKHELTTNKLVWKLYLKRILDVYPSMKALDVLCMRIKHWDFKNHLKTILKKGVVVHLEMTDTMIVVQCSSS